jgi:cytoskeletal protein RodZ
MSFNKEDEEKKDSSQNEDDFGLPDLDYKPLDQLEENSPEQPRSEPSPLMEEFDDSTSAEKEPIREEIKFEAEAEQKSKAPIFIAMIIGVVVLAAAFLVWKYVIVPSNEKAKQEQLAKEKALKAREEEARLAKQREEEERQRLAAEAAANAKPAEGTIEVLENPTKRYYVVITSAVDADLTMDYAKKLSAKGVSSKIIPPFGKWKFNRLAIADFDNFQAAQSQADAAKADYGDAVWVIRY